MTAQLRLTILGCGSSGGVPRLSPDGTGDWGLCDAANPKNRRRRCSLLVEKINGSAVTRALIDTSPDMREQLLDARTGQLDGVLYTHSHADHVHGLDDLRQVVYNTRRRLPVWADAPTAAALRARFAYAFVQEPGSPYPAILDLNLIDNAPFAVDGAAGPITFTPFSVNHGSIDALGFRVGNAAYLPDVLQIPPPAWAHLQGLDLWILDALRPAPHPSHAHLALSLSWIDRAAPARAVLTNMHLEMDYASLCAQLPAHITPAYDGLSLTLPLPE
jgi:phosphoribosyl 1,2-cyclic phosphate phosphodiesterase